MAKYLVALAFVVLAACAPHARPSARIIGESGTAELDYSTESARIRVAAAATVEVVTPTGRGSGAHIGRGYVLTAYHVVKGDAMIAIQRVGPGAAFGRPAALVAFDEANDLAILISSDTDSFPDVPIREDSPSAFDECLAIGFPGEGSCPRASIGLVQCIDGRDLEYSAHGYFGSSGGPILTRAWYNSGAYWRWEVSSVTQRIHVAEYQGLPVPMTWKMIGCAPLILREFVARSIAGRQP